MLHRFTFQNGAVSYANKYLQSRGKHRGGDGQRTDHCAGVWHGTRPFHLSAILLHLRADSLENANVNLAQVDGSTLAITDAPVAMQFELQTLKTLGVFDYGGDKLPGVITTAHPHIDPQSGSSVNFMTEMGFKNRYSVYQIWPGQKRRERIGTIPIQEPALICTALG